MAGGYQSNRAPRQRLLAVAPHIPLLRSAPEVCVPARVDDCSGQGYMTGACLLETMADGGH